MKAKPKSSRPNNGGDSKSGKVNTHQLKANRVKRVRPLAPERFVEIIERINDGLVVLDNDWRYVYVNQRAAVMLQRQKPSDLIGKHIWTEYPEGVGQPFHLAYEKAMREQTSIVFEDYYKPWDLWLENRIYPSPDSLLILFTEITDRKRIETLLNERQYLLQKILDTEPGTVYIYDLEERRNVYINRHWLSAFGYTAEETQALGDQLLDRIFHPDDLINISTHHENWKQAGEGDIREIEYRIRAKTGEWRWLRSREAAFARDEAGRVRQILGIAHDVTEQIQMQKAVLKERDFSDAILNSLPGVFYFYDHTGKFLRWNRNFEIVSGYSGEEIAQMHPLNFFVGEEKEYIAQRIQEVFEKGESDAEANFVSKNGELTPYYFTGKRIEIENAPYLIGMGIDITQRRQAEAELRQIHQNYVTLVNSIDGIVWEAEAETFQFTFVSQQAERLLGYPVERWLTESSFWKDHIYPHDQEWAIDFCAKSTREKRPHDFEYRMVAADGRIVWLRDIVTVVVENDQPVRLRGIMVDITKQKQAEEATKESEERLRLTFEAAKIGTGELDLQANQTTFSSALQQVLGFASGTFNPTFEGYTERVHPEDRAIVRQVVENAKAGRPDIALDYRIVWPDGSLHWVTSRAKAFYDGAGKATRIVAALMDITERKQAEVELQEHRERLEELVKERTEELAAAMVRAQESDRLKSAFLATMSHELRTPLNSIIGFTGVILQGLAGPLNEEQTKQLNMTRNSARHLLALINDILDISKIEAGQLEIIKRPFDMRKAIESVLRVVQPLAQKKNLQLITSIKLDVGIINSDQRRVEQVLINLVNNSIKFTERGQVSIECQISNGWLETQVRDSGIGIKSEDMDRLFKPFQQIDTGPARAHEGTGLGLAICKRLVTALGGEITVESQWGVGSIFKFTLPM